MDALKLPYECICINDASRDETQFRLDEAARTYGDHFRNIQFATNRGQGAALFSGLKLARGEILITLDGDGQNDPNDIAALLKLLEQTQADLICGIRQQRQDTWLRKSMSRFANRVRSRVLSDRVCDAGCALKVMKKEVVDALLPIRTLYSFIPAFATAAGFEVGELPVHHRQRNGGRSSYGLRAFMIYPLIDMLGIAWFRKRSIHKALRAEAKSL